MSPIILLEHLLYYYHATKSAFSLIFLPVSFYCFILILIFTERKTKYQRYALTLLPGLRRPQPLGEIHSQQTLFGEGSLRVNFLVPFHFPFTYIKFRCYTNDAQLLLLIIHNSTISPENRRRCLRDINVESY